MTNSLNSNPGCLTTFLRLIGLAHEPHIPPPPITSAQLAVKSPEPVIPELKAVTPELLPYRTRDDFLSSTELSFYHVLASVVGERAILCPKVGLAEIFFVTRPHENQTYRNRIQQKHLDFLLCDPKTLRPIVGIELDDTSHDRADRQERDKFVEQVFGVAKLPLLRLPARYTYNTHVLAMQLVPYLGDTAADKASLTPPMSPATALPLCAKCGVPMVVRTVKQGEHQGKQFYGCPNYPRCRETRPLSVPTHSPSSHEQ